jgi:hypothetical protein
VPNHQLGIERCSLGSAASISVSSSTPTLGDASNGKTTNLVPSQKHRGRRRCCASCTTSTRQRPGRHADPACQEKPRRIPTCPHKTASFGTRNLVHDLHGPFARDTSGSGAEGLEWTTLKWGIAWRHAGCLGAWTLTYIVQYACVPSVKVKTDDTADHLVQGPSQSWLATLSVAFPERLFSSYTEEIGRRTGRITSFLPARSCLSLPRGIATSKRDTGDKKKSGDRTSGENKKRGGRGAAAQGSQGGCG